MKEIFFWGCLAFFSLVVFLVFLVVGIVQKKSKFIVISILAIFLSMGSALFTWYKVIHKSVDKLTELFTPRSGEEIYAALFDSPQTDCVKIKSHKDQLVPKIDFFITLHFETCPEELDRILLQNEYVISKCFIDERPQDLPSSVGNLFKPLIKSDSIYIYDHVRDEYGSRQIIVANLSRTEAFCVDFSE